MIRVLPAADRFRSTGPGIESWHCFSAGAHYDPGNVGFGPLVGVDEHLVAPGAGFARHAHAGVDIVSWVLAGTLRHEDSTGRVQLVRPGDVLWQHAGSRIEHSETNASGDRPLRFVQATLLAGEPPADSPTGEPAGWLLARPPLLVGSARFDVLTGPAAINGPGSHLYVAAGAFTTGGGRRLGAGDSLRADEPLHVDGSGELLAWLWPDLAPVG